MRTRFLCPILSGPDLRYNPLFCPQQPCPKADKDGSVAGCQGPLIEIPERSIPGGKTARYGVTFLGPCSAGCMGIVTAPKGW